MAYKRFTNNLDKLHYTDKGAFDIPRLAPFIMGKIPDKWIGFNEVNSFKGDRSLTGVHFFIDDYQFERVWNSPCKYIDILKDFACVIGPDFSMYEDMPMAMQIWNLYRSMYLAKLFETSGLNVIANLMWSGEVFITDIYARHSTVAVSSIGVRDKAKFMVDMEKIIRDIRPDKLLYFGPKIDGLSADYSYDIHRVRFGGDCY